jgi:hypothetical protein
VDLVAALPGFRDVLQYDIGADGLRAVEQKLRLVERSNAVLLAEDGDGNGYDYGSEGFSERKPDIRAEEWLGVHPRDD